MQAAAVLGGGTWAGDTGTKRLLQLLGIAPADSLALLCMVRASAAAAAAREHWRSRCPAVQRMAPLLLLLAAAAAQVGSSAQPAGQATPAGGDAQASGSTPACMEAAATAAAVLAGVCLPSLPTLPFFCVTVGQLLRWGFCLPTPKAWVLKLGLPALHCYTGALAAPGTSTACRSRPDHAHAQACWSRPRTVCRLTLSSAACQQRSGCGCCAWVRARALTPGSRRVGGLLPAALPEVLR